MAAVVCVAVFETDADYEVTSIGPLSLRERAGVRGSGRRFHGEREFEIQIKHEVTEDTRQDKV